MRNHNVLPYSPEARDLSKRLRKSMTPCERIFWDATKNSKLGVVMRRQMPVLDYVVDFYIKKLGIAIEIDGSSHDNSFLKDARRQGRIEELGVTFVRFSNDEVKSNLDNVLRQLKELINDSSK